jgi:ribosomal protein L18
MAQSIAPPVAASPAPVRAAPIPAKVKVAILAMIHGVAPDFIAAARTQGLRPDTLRRWLHEPRCVALVRKERAAYRLSICAGNEHALAQIRDEVGGNSMAKVRSIQLLEAIEDAQVGNKPAAAQLGVVVRITNHITQQPPASAPIVDITPHHAPEPAAEPLLARLQEPIFRIT